MLRSGSRIGVFEISGSLGAGGMGEVYRARDTKLDRDVALKVLPQAFAADADRLARFEREAKTLASLNHPHIAQLHGLEESGGIRALVMELVEGPTLADRLAHGPLPLEEALAFARQIALALEAAHSQGIVHRDLKPANIKIRPDGTIKVLDFGLAKALTEDAAVSADPASSPTLTRIGQGFGMADGTQHGMILGTAAYMSPEQARGHRVDAQADIWAFGCVCYEMLTATRAFPGETVPDILAAILGRAPDWTALPPSMPHAIRRLLHRLLERDQRRRWHGIADARLVIDDVLEGRDAQPVHAMPRPLFPVWAAWAITAIALTAVAASLWLLPARTNSRPTVRVQRLTDLVGLEETPAISPDGRTIAFVTTTGRTRQIWVRLLSGGAPLRVTSPDAGDHLWPRWSPDSGTLIYFAPGAEPGDPGAIWEVSALGGPARRVVTAIGPGDVSHDGTRLTFFRFNDGAVELAVANRDGSAPRTVTTLPAAQYSVPKWSPDDRRIAAVQDSGGARFSSDLFIADVASGSVTRKRMDVTLNGFSWLRDGTGLIVSSSQGSTMSYPPTFNLWTVRLDGSAATQLTFGEFSYEHPDLSARGELVASRLRAQSDIWKFPVSGTPQENVRNGVRITRQTGYVQTATISPDESEVAFLSDNGGHANVWVANVATGEMRPITREFNPAINVAVPVWSPTGQWVNFLSNRNTGTSEVTMWIARPDGSDVRDLGTIGAWVCWSANGELLYYSTGNDGVYTLSKKSVASGATAVVRSDNAIACQTSADGSTLYYGRVLTQATGAWDFEVRRARPESGPSEVIGRVAGARVPTSAINYHGLLSPDERWLAMPLIDGSTTNLWGLATAGGSWRQFTDFGERSVVIARRVAWSRDSAFVYASVSEVDADIVMLAGVP